MRISDWSSDVCSSDLRKSSTFLPFLVSAAIQRGCLPRPVQVSLGLAGLRYFGATLPSLRPFFAALRGAAADFVARPPNSPAMVSPSASASWRSLLRTVATGLRFLIVLLRALALRLRDSVSLAHRPFRSIPTQFP